MSQSGSAKPDLTVLPTGALFGAALAIQHGDDKYGAATRLDPTAAEHLAGALRHIYKYLSGECVDKESNLPHLAHASGRLLLAAQKQKNGEGHEE